MTTDAIDSLYIYTAYLANCYYAVENYKSDEESKESFDFGEYLNATRWVDMRENLLEIEIELEQELNLIIKAVRDSQEHFYLGKAERFIRAIRLFDDAATYFQFEDFMTRFADEEHKKVISDMQFVFDKLDDLSDVVVEYLSNSLILDNHPDRFPILKQSVEYARIQDSMGLKELYGIEGSQGNHTPSQQEHEPEQPNPKGKRGPFSNLPPKILLLHELGFFKLEAVQKLGLESKGKLISAICGGSADNATDYIRECNPSTALNASEKNPYRNKANRDAVKELLEALK